MKRLLRLPSPAMAVAFLALFLVLSGSAVALKGRNLVFSDDIRNGQVRTQDIRNSTVRGRDVRGNTLTGSDVAESRLGKVPSAGSADTAITAARANSAGSADSADTAASATTAANAGAVDGQSMQPFSLEMDADAPAEEPFNAGGFRLVASCPSGEPLLAINETVSASNAITSQGRDATGGNTLFGVNGDFSATELTPQAFTATEGSGTATVGWADGRAATISFGYRDDPFTGTNDCQFYGHVIHG
jgi:hypothetical protein